MAGESSQSAASSSAVRWTHDVFLSFYGQDTRRSFTDHLFTALRGRGIKVFRDNERLEYGEDIWKELVKAIHESEHAIVVISQNYADSKWCLKELTEIVERHREKRLKVFPVFYDVKPSAVRKMEGTFGVRFARHTEISKVERERWRSCLEEVADLRGWDVEGRYETTILEEICSTIFHRLSRNFSSVLKNLIGLEPRVKEMMDLLDVACHDIRFIGICGMGGIGKSTLAQVIFDNLSSTFKDKCFIEDVEKSSNTLVDLQKTLLYGILSSELLDKRIEKLSSTCQGKVLIRDNLQAKKVLVVLDNVDKEEQLNALVGDHEWFGLGSRILITSRDSQILKRYMVINTDKVYEVKLLDDKQALELFCWKTFNKHHPEEDYVKLSKEIVNCANGLPLAIDVFGHHLFGKPIDVWKDARDELTKHSDILDKLEISYKRLEDRQKNLFLDIACFFNRKYKDAIIYKLKALGNYSEFNIDALESKSLLKISEGKIQMHDLLATMGQEIVRKESSKPNQLSRLWCHDDIVDVLKNDLGNDAIESMVLEIPSQGCLQLNFESFSKMINLKLLEIICSKYYDFRGLNIEWEGDPLKFQLSNKLRVLNWLEYPLKCLPTSFQLDNLVVLSLPWSKVKLLWDGQKSLEKLKYVDLSNSSSLMKTPNFSGVLNLEVLILSCCTSLLEIHSSIGFLRQLKVLKLKGCTSLKKLPNEMNLPSLQSLDLSECLRLETFSDITAPSLQSLDLFKCSRLETFSNIIASSLQSLDLSRCSGLEAFSNITTFSNITALSLQSLDLSKCSKLEAFSNIIAPSLNSLDLFECARLKAFSNIRAPLLQSLNLWACSRLEAFPNIVTQSLQSLVLVGCLRLEVFPNITAPSLQCLSLSGCSRLEAFSNIKAPSLKSLDLWNCSRLETFPNITASSLQSLNLSECSRLEAFPNIMATSLQSLDLSKCSRLEAFSNIEAPSLKSLNLRGCSRLETFPNITAPSLLHLDLSECSRLKAFPNITALSLESLALSRCSRLETFPNIATPSLQCLALSGCSRLETFPNIITTSLQSLDLFGCSRLKVFPNMMVPSLKSLNLDKCLRLAKFQDDWNNMSEGMECLAYFYAAETSIRQLPSCIISAKNLRAFKFERSFLDLTSLGVLNLSSLRELRLLLEASFHELGKLHLDIEDFYLVRSRELFHNEVDVGTSTEIRLIDDCSVLAVYFASNGKLYQTVHMDPRTSIFSFERISCSHAMAWGPTLGSEVPGWFTHKSIGSFGSIRSVVNVDRDDDLRECECEWNYEWQGYALFMVYEVLKPDNSQTSKRRKIDEYGNSNSRTFDGNDPDSPTFHCKLQVSEEGPRFPLIFSVPEGPHFGLNGVWIFITAAIFQKLLKESGRWSHVGASIVAGDSNVEVKECGARLVRTSDLPEFFDVLNRIFSHNLDWNNGLHEFCDLMIHYDTPKRWNISSLN